MLVMLVLETAVHLCQKSNVMKHGLARIEMDHLVPLLISNLLEVERRRCERYPIVFCCNVLQKPTYQSTLVQHLVDLDRQMLLDRGQRITRRGIEIIDLEVVVQVGGHHRNRNVVDHRQKSGDLLLLCRDVGGELDDLYRLALRVQDRVVVRFQPDGGALLVDPGELPGHVVAAFQPVPERRIFGCLRISVIDEDTMMLADNLRERVFHHFEEALHELI